MHAYVLRKYGDPDVLQVEEVPAPPLMPDGVRVAVAATALNRADLLQRRGLYPGPPMPFEIPGLEFSGTVMEVGPDVLTIRVGDRVMGLLGGGGYADEVVTPEALVLPVPERLSLEEAAAVPEAFLTAHDALNQLGVGVGDWVLVHAAASGVGTTLVQLSRAMGARVIGTAGGPAKCARVRDLGALHVVDRTANRSFLEVVQEATEGRGVEAIADLVGASYLQDNLASLAVTGRCLVIGTVSGGEATVNLGHLLGRRLTLAGTSLRSRSRDEKVLLTRSVRRHVWPLLADGTVRPIVDRIYAFREMAEAHLRMESNENIGKIVVRVGDVG